MEEPGDRWLQITNLKRPFTHIQLQSLLSSITNVSYFRLNSVKSHCFVEVGNCEEADKVVGKLQGKVWPETGLPLIVEKIAKNVCIPIEEKEVPFSSSKFRKTSSQPQIYWSPVSESEYQRRDRVRHYGK